MENIFKVQTEKLGHTSKVLLVIQVGEVEKGNKGSGEDDQPWLDTGCHKFLV